MLQPVGVNARARFSAVSTRRRRAVSRATSTSRRFPPTRSPSPTRRCAASRGRISNTTFAVLHPPTTDCRLMMSAPWTSGATSWIALSRRTMLPRRSCGRRRAPRSRRWTRPLMSTRQAGSKTTSQTTFSARRKRSASSILTQDTCGERAILSRGRSIRTIVCPLLLFSRLASRALIPT